MTSRLNAHCLLWVRSCLLIHLFLPTSSSQLQGHTNTKWIQPQAPWLRQGSSAPCWTVCQSSVPSAAPWNLGLFFSWTKTNFHQLQYQRERAVSAAEEWKEPLPWRRSPKRRHLRRGKSCPILGQPSLPSPSPAFIPHCYLLWGMPRYHHIALYMYHKHITFTYARKLLLAQNNYLKSYSHGKN